MPGRRGPALQPGCSHPICTPTTIHQGHGLQGPPERLTLTLSHLSPLDSGTAGPGWQGARDTLLPRAAAQLGFPESAATSAAPPQVVAMPRVAGALPACPPQLSPAPQQQESASWPTEHLCLLGRLLLAHGPHPFRSSPSTCSVPATTDPTHYSSTRLLPSLNNYLSECGVTGGFGAK